VQNGVIWGFAGPVIFIIMVRTHEHTHIYLLALHCLKALKIHRKHPKYIIYTAKINAM
jgi:hypothetical protein